MQLIDAGANMPGYCDDRLAVAHGFGHAGRGFSRTGLEVDGAFAGEHHVSPLRGRIEPGLFDDDGDAPGGIRRLGSPSVLHRCHRPRRHLASSFTATPSWLSIPCAKCARAASNVATSSLDAPSAGRTWRWLRWGRSAVGHVAGGGDGDVLESQSIVLISMVARSARAAPRA